MKYLLIAVSAILLYVALLNIEGPREVVYNCSIAEISPDFPPEAREACRALRRQELKKQNYENQI